MKLRSLSRHVEKDPDSPKRESRGERAARTERQWASGLRDCIRRLRALYIACGGEEATLESGEENKGGGEWEQSVRAVEAAVKAAAADIKARGECLRQPGGQTESIRLGHAVRTSIDQAQAELRKMRESNDKLLIALNSAKELKKNAKASKAPTLEAEERRISALYSQRVAEHSALSARIEETAAMLRADASSSRARATAAGPATAVGHSGGLTGGRLRRQRLMDLELDTGPDTLRPYGGAVQQAEDEQTLQMERNIAVQEKQISETLDLISAQVERLKVQALAMSDELGTHKVLLDDTEQRVEEAEKALRNLNKRLKVITQQLKPQMCIVNTICVIIIVAMALYIAIRIHNEAEEDANIVIEYARTVKAAVFR